MYCECTNTGPPDNANGKCVTACLDVPSQTCGNSGGFTKNSLTVFSVYLVHCTVFDLFFLKGLRGSLVRRKE